MEKIKLNNKSRKGTVSFPMECKYMSKASGMTAGPAVCMKPGSGCRPCRDPKSCRFFIRKEAQSGIEL